MRRKSNKPAAAAPVERVAFEVETATVATTPNGYEEVENIVPGSDITLHDGGHLLFGEKATVPVELAGAMRERGQVA